MQRDRRAGALRRVARRSTGALPTWAICGDRARQFLDEQRHAIGAAQDVAGDRRRQRHVARHAADQLRRLGLGQRRQGEPLDPGGRPSQGGAIPAVR